ncbi:MAG: hypothetical protein EA398_07950 [Deltaproteobacteria bacterium]|nr:MAG: hypothetical protein EA398_07950 [Deltaproteobacteria bacterium]
MAKRRRKDVVDEVQDLNLAPIMNMVMILIPLLLLSTEFMKAGVVNISSPRQAQATQADSEEQEEEDPVPRVLIAISSDGFRVMDQRNLPDFAGFTTPIERCGGAAAAGGEETPAGGSPHARAETLPPTICLRTESSDGDALLDRLDYASLYNHLATIRLQPQWYDRFSEENNDVISLLASPEVDFASLMKTMDTVRFFLRPEGTDPGEPSGGANIDAFLLGGGGEPTLEQLENATYLTGGEDGPYRFRLFPDPVLMLPRAGG